ncbi:hypothetical protein ACN2EN_09185 [Aliarcobacter lanthieri]|uniref:hypothetical protein n=1 Tax=Aliarcobacter lanthieri TaxID=1355374 RepID=UPI003AFAB33F
MKNKIIEDIHGRYFDIIRRKNTSYWKEYTYDAKQKASDNNIRRTMKALNNPIKIQIPLKENIRYKNIETFEDHHLSNNLALDMIIRNKEFQKYIYFTMTIDFEFENRPAKLKENHYKKLQLKLIEKFGFNIKDTDILITHHPYLNEEINEFLENIANANIVLNRPYIRDIKNGLRKVIDFYLKKKKLYLFIPPSKYEIITNEDVKNANDKQLFAKIINPVTSRVDYILLSIYEEYKQYHIRADDLIYFLPKAKLEVIDSVDDDFIENNLSYLGIPIVIFGSKKIISLAVKNLPIEFLDKEFISSLTIEETIDTHFESSKIETILPKLKLMSSKSITNTINPNLSSYEANAITLNLKNASDSIKSFSEIFSIKIDEILKVKNLKHISKSKELRNRDYANAFYIYDLYSIIEKEFNKKILELRNEAEINKNKVKNNTNFETKERKNSEYEKISRLLRENESLFSKTYLDEEIQKITNLEISKIRGLHSLIKEYIEEYKFKNIILGK